MANKFFIFLFVSLFSVVGYSETLKFGIAQSPQNLHPHLNRDAASEKIVDLVYEKIFDLAGNVLAVIFNVGEKNQRNSVVKKLKDFTIGEIKDICMNNNDCIKCQFWSKSGIECEFARYPNAWDLEKVVDTSKRKRE